MIIVDNRPCYIQTERDFEDLIRDNIGDDAAKLFNQYAEVINYGYESEKDGFNDIKKYVEKIQNTLDEIQEKNGVIDVSYDELLRKNLTYITNTIEDIESSLTEQSILLTNQI